MDFTDILYHSHPQLFCHGREVCYTQGQFHCQQCQRLLLDSRTFFAADGTDTYESCFLAKCYAAFTGDVNFPCAVSIQNIPGIQPCRIVTDYGTLNMVTRMLGALTSEFIHYRHAEYDTANQFDRTKVTHFTKYFLSRYMAIVENVQCDDQNVKTILVAVLSQMKEQQQVDFMDHYFSILCPYVKMFGDDMQTYELQDPHSPNKLLDELNTLATRVRQRFGVLSIQFDIVYVMVYCYLCGYQVDVLANLVLDFIKRVVSEQFVSENHLTSECRNLLQKHITPTTHYLLYQTKKQLASREGKDLLSVELFRKITQMQETISPHFLRSFPFPNPRVAEYALTQVFPFVLFPTTANYYGFMGAMSLMLNNYDQSTNTLKKDSTRSAKLLFEFLETYCLKFQEFVAGSDIPYFTLDFLQMFIGSDEQFVHHLRVILEESQFLKH